MKHDGQALQSRYRQQNMEHTEYTVSNQIKKTSDDGYMKQDVSVVVKTTATTCV